MVTGIVIALVLLLRRKKYQQLDDFDEDLFELHNDESNSIVTQNPLHSILDKDDPFEDEFDLPNAY